jgi:uncharacterized protein YbjT (DUF2867 family)
MNASDLNVVTGSFSYTGKYITSRLLSLGRRVRALTRNPDRPNPFGGQVEVAPLLFDRPRELANSLAGATTLFNTYWIRFPYKGNTFDTAIENTRILIKAAEAAGVRRIVHVSVTCASQDSPLAYFRGKGQVERAIINSRLSYAILRPALIFGPEDILINNIAWFLRRFPIFAILGNGKYRLQPISAEDLAAFAVDASDRDENLILDTVGPETYEFEELVSLLKAKIKSNARTIHMRPRLGLLLCKLLGLVVDDVVLTREEVEGLMSNLLTSISNPAGQVRFSDWVEKNAAGLGTSYASELNRHHR